MPTKGKEYLRCSSCQKTRRVIEISTPETTWLFFLSLELSFMLLGEGCSALLAEQC